MRDIHKMDQCPEGLGRETGEQAMERGERKGEKGVTQLPRGRELADGAQTSVGCWGAAVVGLRFVLVSVPPPVLNISTFLAMDSILSDNLSLQPYRYCVRLLILWPVSCLEASVQIMSCAVVVTWLI